MRLCVECNLRPTRALTPQARYCSTSCRDRANHKRRTAVRDDLKPHQIDALFARAVLETRQRRWRAA